MEDISDWILLVCISLGLVLGTVSGWNLTAVDMSVDPMGPLMVKLAGAFFGAIVGLLLGGSVARFLDHMRRQ